MVYKQLFILLEGDDDKRLLEKINVKSRNGYHYRRIRPVKTRHMCKRAICNLVKSIKENDDDYIYLTDIDKFPCKTTRKDNVIESYDEISKENIIIVEYEIESWYYGGLSDQACQALGACPLSNTDRFTKGDFKEHVPKSIGCPATFKREILKYYCIETAKQKNSSFGYFAKKFDL